MELLLMAIVLHALCLSQGVLHKFSLSETCSGTLQILQNDSWVPVILNAQSQQDVNVTQQICVALGCGNFLKFRENKTAQINTFLTGCIIRNSVLHNCTAAAPGNCSSVMEVECEHQAVRLAAGHDRCAGRVELLHNNQWGSVCDDEWNSSGADVVCAQLGCGTALKWTPETSYFGPGTGPIHMSKLNCTGRESNLWQCSTQEHEESNYCGHKEDAGVICSGSTATTATPTNTTEPAPNNWTTDSTTVMVIKDSNDRLSAAVWGCIGLSIALLLVLLSNAALCKHYRRRNACVIHQRLDSHMGEDRDINNLQAVTAHPVTVHTSTYGERDTRRPSLQDDSETSSGSDYEYYNNFGVVSPVIANNLHNDAHVVGECNQVQERSCKEENALKNTTDDVDSESTSSGECYENTQPEQEQLLNPDKNQFYPEHSLQMAPLPNTSQSANTNHDADSESTSSGECYENTQPEQDQPLNPDGNQFHPEHSLQMAPLPNTSQSANRNQDWSDSDSTSSGDCYENIGMEAEAFVQTFEGSPSLPEQNPPSHHTPQPTGNSNLLVPSSPNQDDSSTSSDDAYENVPDIDEENCQSSTSSDYDDVANW